MQSLYEKKLCTYPQTDSRYLTDDMQNSVRALILCCENLCGMVAPDVVMLNQVCDSSKVTDHHAIIPTIV